MDPKAKNLGPEVDPTPAAYPDNTVPIKGTYVTLEAFKHDSEYASLWKHLDLHKNAHLFDFLPMSFASNEHDLREKVDRFREREFVVYAIKADASCVNPGPGQGGEHSDVVGMISYLSVHPEHRELEVGGVIFSPVLQRSAAATEANYLMLRNAMDTGSPGLGGKSLPYRRVCWKCNSLNAKSRRAAERLGYVFEGRFRKHWIVKGRSRDSDWLSVVDDEWPKVKLALEKWLERGNFDEQGRQIKTVDEIRAALVK